MTDATEASSLRRRELCYTAPDAIQTWMNQRWSEGYRWLNTVAATDLRELGYSGDCRIVITMVLPPDSFENLSGALPKSFFENIDWKLLRRQKETLLEVMGDLTSHPKDQERLEGILNLLDDLQDYAADTLGIKGVFSR